MHPQMQKQHWFRLERDGKLSPQHKKAIKEAEDSFLQIASHYPEFVRDYGERASWRTSREHLECRNFAADDTTPYVFLVFKNNTGSLCELRESSGKVSIFQTTPFYGREVTGMAALAEESGHTIIRFDAPLFRPELDRPLAFPAGWEAEDIIWKLIPSLFNAAA